MNQMSTGVVSRYMQYNKNKRMWSRAMALLRGLYFSPCLVPPSFPSTPINLALMPSQFPPNHATSCHRCIVVVDGRMCRQWNAHVVDGQYLQLLGGMRFRWAIRIVIGWCLPSIGRTHGGKDKNEPRQRSWFTVSALGLDVSG